MIKNQNFCFKNVIIGAVVLSFLLIPILLEQDADAAAPTIQWRLGAGLTTSVPIGQGQISVAAPGSFVFLRVDDPTATYNDLVKDTIVVHVVSTDDSTGIDVTLEETDVDSKRFENTKIIFTHGDVKPGISDSMTIEFVRSEANELPGVIETLDAATPPTVNNDHGLLVKSNTNAGFPGFALGLVETGADTGTFQTTLKFTTGSAVAYDAETNEATLNVALGDTITVFDFLSTNVYTNTIIFDPSDLKINAINAESEGDVTATFTSNSGEAATPTVLDITPDAGGAGRGGGGVVTPSLVVDSDPTPETTDTSGGGGDSSDPPTIGLDANSVQQVDFGFFHNKDKYEITDNFWTPFDKVKIKVGSPQFIGIKSAGAHEIKRVEFGLVPEVGMMHKADVLIEVWVDDENPHLVIKQGENIIDQNLISPEVILRDEDCFEGTGKKECTFIGISNVMFREEPFFEVIGLKIVDTKNRSTTTYLNDGFDISGKSMNPPKTGATISNEKGVGRIDLVQIDKWKNIWADDKGIEYFKNSFGTYIRQTPVEHEIRQDKVSNVMNRANNNFDEIIRYEQMRAEKIFDSDNIQSEITDSWNYKESSNQKRFDNSEFTKYFEMQGEIAKQIWDSSKIQGKLSVPHTFSDAEE